MRIGRALPTPAPIAAKAPAPAADWASFRALQVQFLVVVQFGFQRNIVGGVIPSGAVLQAKRGISRASLLVVNTKLHHRPIPFRLGKRP
jgi:hypothetical protein